MAETFQLWQERGLLISDHEKLAESVSELDAHSAIKDIHQKWFMARMDERASGRGRRRGHDDMCPRLYLRRPREPTYMVAYVPHTAAHSDTSTVSTTTDVIAAIQTKEYFEHLFFRREDADTFVRKTTDFYRSHGIKGHVVVETRDDNADRHEGAPPTHTVGAVGDDDGPSHPDHLDANHLDPDNIELHYVGHDMSATELMQLRAAFVQRLMQMQAHIRANAATAPTTDDSAPSTQPFANDHGLRFVDVTDVLTRTGDGAGDADMMDVLAALTGQGMNITHPQLDDEDDDYYDDE